MMVKIYFFNKNTRKYVESSDLKERIIILLEHVLFAVWGYYVIVWAPSKSGERKKYSLILFVFFIHLFVQ